MRLTINTFKECLQNPQRHFSKLANAEVALDDKNNINVWRTTHFAETYITMDGNRYILCMPLSDDAHTISTLKVQLMNSIRSPFLTTYEILPSEMSYTSRSGEVKSADLIIHQIPEGETLYHFAEFASQDRLLKSLSHLEAEFKRLGIVHHNLTPHNIIVGKDYSFTPIRYHYVEKESDKFDCGEEFASLREWIYTVSYTNNSEHTDVHGEGTSTSLFSSYRYVSNPFEDLICVADEEGYLYINRDNEVVIEGRFKWAGDFHEGRAEVENESGMGLIDKEGGYIINPEFEIVDYDEKSGLSRVRKDHKWALFNYSGEQILPFEDRFIDDEDLELLSI